MSETKKIIIGVLSGVLGIAVLFTLVMMLVGKGDEPISRLQPILAQEPEAVPPDPAQVQVRSQALLAEKPQTEAGAVSSAGRTTQDPGKASTSTSDAQAPPTLVQPECLLGSVQKVPASSTRTEPNPTSEERLASPSVANQAPSGGTPYGTTATGIPTYVCPRGGVYHYSASGKKVYQRRGK
jgi:hypothetical protein